MGRRGRFLVVLGAAVSLSAANPERQQRNQAQAEHNAPVPPRAAYAPYPNWQSESCYKAQDHDSADLCAQWRAAIAAEKAAKATEVATQWSKAATALSALALGALIWIFLIDPEKRVVSAEA